MFSLRMSLVVACVLSLAVGAVAQDAAAPPAMPKVEPVLSHIPAGALGFALVNNIGEMSVKVDKFLADLGLDQMLANPNNPQQKLSVLDLARGALRLGPDLNPNGGAAVVMLDPQPFGVDVLQLMQLKPAPPAGEGQPPKPQPKVPFVIFVPGKSVEGIFGAYKMAPAGKYTLVELRMGPTYAGTLGGYVILSPNAIALDAVLASQTPAVKALPPEQVEAITRADVAYSANMRVASPIVNAILTQMEGQIVRQVGPLAPLMSTYMSFYREMLSQLGDVTVAGRFVPTGLALDEMISFRPDSAYGKAMLAGGAQAEATGLGLVPNLKYVLGLAAVGDSNPQSIKLTMDAVDGLLTSEALKGLPDDTKARIQKLVREMSEQYTGSQVVLGGAPQGSGLFGADFVIQCKDSAKVKDLLAEKAAIAQDLVRFFGKDDKQLQELTIRYIKAVETVGSVSVDAIDVNFPALANLKEQERADMRKILGEDKIRFLIAAVGKDKVIVTFGGGQPFLLEALKAAAAGQDTITTLAPTAEAMKYLPKKRTALMLFNAADLYELVVAAMKTMAPDEEPPPFKITCQVPIAAGVGITGTSAHVALYVPTELVKQVAGIVMMFAAPRPQAPPPMRGGGDF